MVTRAEWSVVGVLTVAQTTSIVVFTAVDNFHFNAFQKMDQSKVST